MAFTNPKTWATNEVLTAANFNTHIRDNIDFLARPPSVAVYNTASQLVATSTFTPMNANTELWDTDTMWAVSPNPSRLTATTAGRYEFKTTMRYGTNAAGLRSLGYRVNGGSNVQLSTQASITTPAELVLSGSAMLVLAATNYVEPIGWQDTGGNLDIILQGASLTLVSVV